MIHQEVEIKKKKQNNPSAAATVRRNALTTDLILR